MSVRSNSSDNNSLTPSWKRYYFTMDSWRSSKYVTASAFVHNPIFPPAWIVSSLTSSTGCSLKKIWKRLPRATTWRVCQVLTEMMWLKFASLWRTPFTTRYNRIFCSSPLQYHRSDSGRYYRAAHWDTDGIRRRSVSHTILYYALGGRNDAGSRVFLQSRFGWSTIGSQCQVSD